MLLSVRRLIVLVFAVGAGVLMFASASALAVAPETPGPVTAEHFGATRVTVHGLLSPKAEGHPGTYEFLYKASKTECEAGEHASSSAPGLAMGGKEEYVSQELTGLSAETEYTVCLAERNLNQAKGEETVGPALTFKTTGVLEAPTITAPASASITSSSAKFQGVLNPGKPGSPGFYEFVYSQSGNECEHEDHETHQIEGEHTTSTEATLGNEKEAVPSTGPIEVGGLLPNVDYTVCLLARNEAGETALSSPVTFTTLSEKPGISGESVLQVGSESATVGAQVATGGLETTYSVQYGASAAYGSETTPASLPAGGSTVSATLTGLQANTEYHYRFLVKNTDGNEVGGDVKFTTYPAGLSGLPDNRVYEMVSPVENENAEVYVPTQTGAFGFYTTFRPFQASAEGNAIVYESEPTTGGNGVTGSGFGDAQLASRSPGGGWIQTTIQPSAHGKATYQAFSPNLSRGIVSDCDQPVLASDAPTVPGAEVGYNLIYEHENASGGDAGYSPLFTTVPRNRRPSNIANEEGVFGRANGRNELEGCPHELVYAGASEDFSHLLFEANDSLLEGNGLLEKLLESDTKAEAEESKAQAALEKEVTGLEDERRQLEKEGRGQEAAEKEEEAGKKDQEAEALAGHDEHNDLYVSVGGRLGLVNVLPDGSPEPNATFGGVGSDFSRVISADGSRVFWTDLNSGVVYARVNGTSTIQISTGPAQYWTASSNGQYVFYTEGEKLYRFDTERETREELAGAGAGVQGVIGGSEDGQYLYFAADGSLVAGASEGQPNLYEWHDGSISLVATLAGGDSADWASELGPRNAEVTPDGLSVVFMSEASLTGYPTEGQQEVYVYESEPHGVYCASCKPSGLPGGSGFLTNSWSKTYMTRSISADGSHVFFNSEASLVPQDTDGTENVYEWDRDGAGDCQLTSGCLYLLSGGTGGATFVDASVSGNDAFFITASQLVSQDNNEALNVYDARADGLPIVKTECSGTGCQGVPAPPPTFATPASVTFNGVGNFPPPSAPAVKPEKKTVKCAKGKKLSHGKCVKNKKKTKSKKDAERVKRASYERKASR